MATKKIQVYDTKEKLAEAATNLIIGTIDDAVQNHGRCAIALAGGNTPRAIYRLLADEQFKSRIDWNALHLFWGDERTVPPDHPESNFGMAQEALLSRVPLPEENNHRIRGEIPPQEASEKYTNDLRLFFLNQPPQLDLILLGIGDDGHTASLFPGTEAVTEAKKPVAAVFVPKLDTWRVTMTLPLINSAKKIAFIVSGSSKSQIVGNLLRLDKPESKWPASLVRPENAIPQWLLDVEAAALIAEEIH